MKILEELFYGNIRPCDNQLSAEVRKAHNVVTSSVEKLLSSLPDDTLRTELNEVLYLQSD